MAQQRRLAGAVSAHQRDALTGREAESDPAQNRRAVAQLMPDTPHREGGLVLASTTSPRLRRWSRVLIWASVGMVLVSEQAVQREGLRAPS